jgi:hypothetical protein
MYTLYDSKAEFYSAPFFANFDFTLFEVGSFNSDSGLFEALPNLRQVVAGSMVWYYLFFSCFDGVKNQPQTK